MTLLWGLICTKHCYHEDVERGTKYCCHCGRGWWAQRVHASTKPGHGKYLEGGEMKTIWRRIVGM